MLVSALIICTQYKLPINETICHSKTTAAWILTAKKITLRKGLFVLPVANLPFEVVI